MTNRKSTKRALLGSVMAMVLCLAMLVGATFAWFTDTASTGVNKIQAGNLNIELQYATKWDANGVPTKWENAEGKTLPFLVNGEIPAEGTQILWEPGCTYMLPEVRVVNKGNLAVKFEYVPEALGVTGKLADVLKLVFKAPDDNIEPEVLLPGETSPAWSFGYHMDEAAGNDYQNATAAGAYVTVVATQAASEYDSFNNTYDENAVCPVVSAAGLKEALTKGGIVTLAENVVADSPMNVTGTAILNATGKTVSNTTDIWNDDVNDWSLISAQGNADLTINGGSYQGKANDCYAVDLQDKGVVVTIKDGKFIGNISAVYVFEGELKVEGGFFDIQQKNSNGVGGPYDYVLNCYDASYKNGTAKITVTGGTFVNFDPSNCMAEGAGTNFVPDGYKVVSQTQTNGDVWYTVVKG